ncbi:hypothetical protein BCR42DRAFT_452490 [Absidia repens]|uniref:Uncharacterized protein n=1 Tax=Absidia repens TaxID=90262 RepID=A0A1X2IE74_9FUNG|nr:hypothetical protein BCR42DRAFT_452490 [Absidia repens]
MSLHHIPFSQSVIINVLRAITSRSISTNSAATTTCSLHSSTTRSLTSPYFWTSKVLSAPEIDNILPFKRQLHCTASTRSTASEAFEYNNNDDIARSLCNNNMNQHIHDKSILAIKTSTGKIKWYRQIYRPSLGKYATGYHFKETKYKTVDDYNKRILFAVMNGQQNMAINYLREMERRQLKPDVYIYTMIINGYSKQSDMTRATKWMKRMRRNGRVPDVYTYTSLIDGYMRLCDLDKVEGIFKRMIRESIQPNLVTYNVMMHHSVLKLDMEAAVKFWGKLSEAGIQPDVYTYAIMIHGLGDDGLVDEAWRIFDKMKKQNVDVNHVVATTLMGIHVRHKDNAYAIQLFQEFFEQQKQLVPTRHTRNILLNATMGHTSLSNIKTYYQQFISLLDNRYSSNNDETPTHSVLWGDHYNVSNNVYTYTSFMRAFLRHNDIGMVTQIYKDMLTRQVKPTLVTFATLMLAHAFVPDPHACENMLKELQSHNIKANAALYTIVMRAWAKAKHWDQVKRVYDEMKLDKIQPNKMTLEVLRWAKNEAVV